MFVRTCVYIRLLGFCLFRSLYLASSLFLLIQVAEILYVLIHESLAMTVRMVNGKDVLTSTNLSLPEPDFLLTLKAS